MKHLGRNFRAISPVLAVLMMIAVAIAGSLVVYAWVMGYIGLSNEKAGQEIKVNSVANSGTDLLVYVQNTGEGVAQLDEAGCLYVNGQLLSCSITGVTVSDDVASLGEGETATLRCIGGAASPGEKVDVKVTTLLGTAAGYYDYPAGTASPVPGAASWNRTYGRTGNDQTGSLIATSDGGYAIAGHTDSFGSFTPDFWLIKTDAYGNEEWNRTYGGPDQSIATALVEASDGGYLIVGNAFSFVEIDEYVLLVKTDADGNMEWNKTYGGTDKERVHSLIVTSDGGYAMAGYTTSYGAGSYDFWLIKLDASGTMEWNQTYGGTSHDTAWSLVETLDGGYALAGDTHSFGAGGSDLWIVKTNSAGVMEWNRTYGGANYDVPRALVAISDGGYALAGNTRSFGAGQEDFWLIKTNSLGDVEWNQTYGGTEEEGVYSLIQTSDGGYAVAGFTESFGAGDNDFWLVKTDASGKMEWSETYGGTEWETADSLIQTSDGGYSIAGITNSFGAGDFDCWLVKTY